MPVKQFHDSLTPTGYMFSVHRLPNTSFTVQSANIPSISLSDAPESTPFVNIPLAGNNMRFGDLNIRFIVDQDMSNYMEIFNWIQALGHAEGFDQYAALNLEPGTGVASECTLVVLDNRKQPGVIVTFHEAVPIALDEISFDASISGSWNTIQTTATFRYRSFEIELNP